MKSPPLVKAVFFSLPLHGHINPTLPLVRELVERGDRIAYYSTPAFAANRTGRRAISPVSQRFSAGPAAIAERLEELSPC
jgi:hypothetical protein